MYINTFKYTPKDVSCQLCTEYVKKLGCTALRCPWLAERIEAGVVGYREAVMETFPRDRRLSSRLNLLIKHYPGSLWSNEQHECRMQYQCAVQGYPQSCYRRFAFASEAGKALRCRRRRTFSARPSPQDRRSLAVYCGFCCVQRILHPSPCPFVQETSAHPPACPNAPDTPALSRR